MNGHAEKYKSWPRFVAAYLYREWLRMRLRGLVSWKKTAELGEGCTVILGMSSKLPYLLGINLEGLRLGRWPDLKEVLIVVDSKEGSLPDGFAEDIQRRFPELGVRFLYYSEEQHRWAERLKYPYVYAWLSWVLAMNEARTKVALIHDYDAIVLSDALGRRYRRFVESGAVMQGVLWYWTQGIVAEDRLVATFEAFLDLEWARKFHPIEQINKVGWLNGRRVDYDILTEMQARDARPDQRDIEPMGPNDLVHPTQMISQYTMFRKFPAKFGWHCSSLLMIPFFYHRSGRSGVLQEASARIRASQDKNIDLLGDGVVINFSKLNPEETDLMLKNMLQVCVKMSVPPLRDLVDYGEAVYELAGAPFSKRWTNSFDPAHLDWVRRSRT